MKSNPPRLTLFVLAACVCAILSVMAWPARAPRGRRVLDTTEAAAASDASRSGAARFEKQRVPPAAPAPAPARDTSALWRKLMLEQRLEALAIASTPLELAFPVIGPLRARPSSAPTEQPSAAPIEASAPVIRVVGRGNVSGVWEGASVPLQLLDGPSHWLTPSVGRVRAELADGTAFEGRLHSLGEGKLWIENDLGRVALLGAQIRTLRQLPPIAAAGPGNELPELPSVRVRTPGGLFEGRLLRREEGRVTLLTAEGGQVTLDDAEVEPVRPGTSLRNP